MNKDITQAGFGELRSRIKQQWSQLTVEDIDQVEDAELLVDKLQERYGWERAEAERQVKDFSSRHGWQ